METKLQIAWYFIAASLLWALLFSGFSNSEAPVKIGFISGLIISISKC